jgi:hypothetical protein
VHHKGATTFPNGDRDPMLNLRNTSRGTETTDGELDVLASLTSQEYDEPRLRFGCRDAGGHIQAVALRPPGRDGYLFYRYPAQGS